MMRVAACVAALLAGFASGAPVAIPILSGTTFGLWEGWGVSLAGWAVVWGQSPALADVAFSCAEAVAVPGLPTPLPGLCLNIARFNVGGSSNRTAAGDRIVYSARIPWWKQARGFWLDYESDDPASPSFDWTADANQQAMLLAARARGADTFELFSNSPMWWMLYNHNPSGADDGSKDNLQAWNVANHSKYMAIVAAHTRDLWNVSWSSIELFNEPIANWWTATGTQEGCHFDASTQAAALRALPAELAARNLTGHIRVAASDESRIDMALSTWSAFDAPTRAIIDQVNVHGYQEGGDRAALYAAAVVAGGKVLRDSEYGDGDGSGGTLASSVLADWAALHPRGWCYWQLIDVADGWGMIKGDADSGALTAVNTKHYVVAQFSRHIKPGMRTLGTGDPRNATAAAYDAARQRLVVVVANQQAAAADFTVELASFFQVPPGPVAGAWITSTASAQPDPAAAHSPLAGLAVDDSKSVALSLPPWSVVTIEVAGVAV
jgi:galactan endo-1,6-beta-galactosidase